MKSKYNINQLLGKQTSISQKYHQKTKLKNLKKGPNDYSKWPIEWKTVYFKEYPRLDKIILPPPETIGSSLQEALTKRSSERKYSKEPISLEKLSTLLFFSSGLKSDNPPYQGQRFYPSAGARYPLEVYLISQNSELPNGLYHYNLLTHSLESLLTFKKFYYEKYFNQTFIKNTPIIILFTAVFWRNTIKYGDRGYRHILSEAGHMGQNFYLLCAALNLGICGVGGYNDDKLNTLLDIDGVSETIIYVLTIGNIK